MALTNRRPLVDPDEDYPIGEAAKKLGIDRGTLRRYAKSGVIDFDIKSVPSTIPGREKRSYFSFRGQHILDYFYKCKGQCPDT